MAELPRITDQWGKYAKKTESKPTTTVTSGNTTITTNGKTQINIFNRGHNHSCHKPSNVFLNGKHYHVPVNTYAGNTNFGFPSIFPNFGYSYNFPYGGYYQQDKLSNFEKAMIAIKTVGPGNVLALGGGILAGLGSAIKDMVTGGPNETYIPANNATAAAATSAQNAVANYSPINDKNYKDLNAVQDYNSATDELKPLSDAVSSKAKLVNQATQTHQEAQKTVNKHQLNIKDINEKLTTAKSELSSAESELQEAQNADPKDEQLISQLEEKVESLKEKVEELNDQLQEEQENLTDAQKALKDAESEKSQATSEFENAEKAFKAKETDVQSKKAKADDAIRQVNEGLDPEQISTSTNSTNSTNSTTSQNTQAQTPNILTVTPPTSNAQDQQIKEIQNMTDQATLEKIASGNEYSLDIKIAAKDRLKTVIEQSSQGTRLNTES